MNIESNIHSDGRLSRDQNKPCVIVADDDRDMRALMSRLLVQEGYEVRPFSAGDTVLEHIGGCFARTGSKVRRPDVVVVDICMPGLSGLELLRGLRKAETGIPFVVVTARLDPEARRLAGEYGAAAFLTKPFEAQDFLAVVNAATAVSEQLLPRTKPARRRS